MEVIIDNEFGYKWTNNEHIYFKGYFQFINDEDAKVFKDEKALSYLGSIKTLEDFKSFLTKIDGLFCIIINDGRKVWAAVDSSRSLPLYYSKKYISDSAEAIRQKMNIHKENVDFDNYIELLALDYLFGNDTVYKEIQQLNLGQYLYIDSKTDNIVIDYYFKHISTINDEFNEIGYAKEKIEEESYKAFLKIKEAIEGRPVVLSLSSGYDSRFIACMLKKVGVTDVSCYTYGKKSSFEIEESRKVAEALGYRWKWVEMTDEWMSQQLDEVGKRYLNCYKGHDFTAYVQNFPAFRKLHEEGWIKPNSVCLTGLCGDMPTGTYIEAYDSNKSYNKQTATDRLYSLICQRYDLPSYQTDIIKKKLTAYLDSCNIYIQDYQSWVSAIDCVYTGLCHSHWFMHMNTVHSFFGYEFLMPFWDRGILKLWYSIPAGMRIGRKLYESWLLDDVCTKYGIGQKKYVAKYSSNNYKRKFMYIMGGIISFVMLNSKMVFKRKYDYNNFAPYELCLFSNLCTKKTVKYKKAGLFHLLNQYCLQYRYGKEIMLKAIKVLR